MIPAVRRILTYVSRNITQVRACGNDLRMAAFMQLVAASSTKLRIDTAISHVTIPARQSDPRMGGVIAGAAL